MRIRERFSGKMLAAAKSDFEPHLADRCVEQRGRIGGVRGAGIERKARQQMFDQVGLMIAKLVPLTPSEERTVAVVGVLRVR